MCRRLDSDVLHPLAEPKLAGSDVLALWKDRYWRSSVRNDDVALLEIGTEMFDWLNTANAREGWLKDAERHLQILPDDGSAPDLASVLLEAPWEILHHHSFLGQNPAQLFVVSRSVMPSTNLCKPQHGDLRMMFMAAGPEGQSELDYEAEEVAILNAAKHQSGLVRSWHKFLHWVGSPLKPIRSWT